MTAGAKSLAVFYHPTMQADGADVPTHTTHQGYRWLLGACWGVLLGSALQLQQAALSGMAVYVLAVLAGPAVCGVWPRVRRPAPMGLGVVVLATALVAWGLCGLRATVFAAGVLPPALEGRDVLVTGVVSRMPQRHPAGLRLRLVVESAELEGRAVQLPGLVDVGWYGGQLANAEGASEDGAPPAAVPDTLRAGERWRMRLRLKAPHGLRNPGGFDYELWLWEQGVQALGTVRTGRYDPVPQRLGQTWQFPVEQLRQRVRDAVWQRLGTGQGGQMAAPESAAGVVAALLVGDQQAIERADWDVFRATGVAHLMSISGLHITMFSWLAVVLVGWAWRRSQRLCQWMPAPVAAGLGGLALAALYAVFSGWGVPAQRTVLMLAVVLLLRLGGRRWPWPLVWLLAGAAVVAVDPWALWQAGFWLSFVAVGVLYAGGPGTAPQLPGLQPGQRALGLWREQWLVTCALTPLVLVLFGQVSLVGLLANLLAIPWVTMVVTPLVMLGMAVPPAWDLAAWALHGLMLVLQWLAAWPFATVSVPSAPWWAAAAGVVGGVLLVLRLPWPVRLLGLPLVLPVLLWQVPRPPAGEFELLAADIGQGSAVLVRTASHALLYDAGPQYSVESDAGHRVLVPLLRTLGERLDTVVLSHRDLDHTGGARAVLDMQAQAALSSSLEPGHALVQQRPGTRCEAGQRWQWDGVDFEVLHPQAADYGAAGAKKSNALSCVLRIGSAHGTHALLAGDIETAQESRLVSTGAPLRADWLLVPHHGSKTSSSDAFLAAVRPGVALVQAGYRNRFGHPAPSVVQRYASHGIRLVDTVHCGAAVWRSDQPAAVSCERERAPRYWQHTPP